jgi:hypothetical protein
LDLTLGEDTSAEFARQWMAELAVYPTVLSQARVIAHYKAALMTPVAWLTA